MVSSKTFPGDSKMKALVLLATLATQGTAVQKAPAKTYPVQVIDLSDVTQESTYSDLDFYVSNLETGETFFGSESFQLPKGKYEIWTDFDFCHVPTEFEKFTIS